ARQRLDGHRRHADASPGPGGRSAVREPLLRRSGPVRHGVGRPGHRMTMVFSLLPDAGAISREHAASLHSILALSMLMTESANEEQILHFATTSLPSLAPSCELAGVYGSETGGWKLGSRRLEHDRQLRSGLERQLATLGQAGGILTVAGAGWGFAFALRSIHECVGFIVVLADADPAPEEQFLLRVLAQQTGVALTTARTVNRR